MFFVSSSAHEQWALQLLHPEDEQGKRRTALLESAFDVIAQTGFEGLRTRAVAERAGVNIATLHYYFPTKQKLIEELAVFIGAKFVTLHGPTPKPSGFPALDVLRQEFADSRYYLVHQPALLLVIQEFSLRGKRDPQVQEIFEQMTNHWRRGLEKLVLQGMEDGTFRSDVGTVDMLSFVMATLSGLAAAGVDRIEAIQKQTESCILSGKAKRHLEKKSEGRKRATAKS